MNFHSAVADLDPRRRGMMHLSRVAVAGDSRREIDE